MKALTGSCSNPIAESLGSHSPRVAIRVSDRPEFCFSLRSKNEKKGYNCCLLKLVQNKGIYPLHAVPPKDQVDLETAEPEALQSEQTNESKYVRVAFQLQKNCDFGEHFLIVGDDAMLGSWDPSDALPMTWSDGHLWTVKLDMPVGKSIQFKFILKGKGGNIIWQPGLDRTIHTWETTNRITVCEDWENAELQKIIEEPQVEQLQKIAQEDQLAQSNEEPQVDSEVSTFAVIVDNPQERLESNVSEVSVTEDTQIHAEEKPRAEPVLQQTTGDSFSSSVEKPMTIVAENIGSSEDLVKSTSSKKNKKNVILSEVSVTEDTQSHAEDKPLAEPVLQQITGDSFSSSMEKPMTIVAENIGSSEDLVKSTSSKKNKKNVIQQSEESADSPGNDDIIPDLGHNGSTASLENQESTTVESSLLDFEGGPVLVPDLIPTLPTDEAGEGEVQDVTTVDTLVGAFETQDQNIPEFSKEQESDDGTPQEINATINNEPELLYNEHEEQTHLSPEMQDRQNYQLVDDNPLQNDIKWGQETVKKFLAKLGFL